MQGMNFGQFGYGSNQIGNSQPGFMGGGMNMQPQNNAFQIQNNGFGRSIQPNYLQGRIVGNEQEIVSGEVPNDGSFAVFVKDDLKTIWAKAWMGDGLIHTNVYQKVEEDAPEKQHNDQNLVFQTILEKLDSIEARVAKIENRQYQYAPRNIYNKKNDNKGNVQNRKQEVNTNESND